MQIDTEKQGQYFGENFNILQENIIFQKKFVALIECKLCYFTLRSNSAHFNAFQSLSFMFLTLFSCTVSIYENMTHKAIVGSYLLKRKVTSKCNIKEVTTYSYNIVTTYALRFRTLIRF